MSTQQFIINGRTWTFPTDLEEDKYVTNLPLLIQDIQADTVRNMVTTSTGSHTLGSGTGSLNLDASIPYVAGQHLQIIDQGNPSTNFALIRVDADVAGGTTLTFTEQIVFGSGVISAWDIVTSGFQGPVGLPGDGRAQVSSNDSTPGYLSVKLIAEPTSGSITFTETVDGGDERLNAAVSDKYTARMIGISYAMRN